MSLQKDLHVASVSEVAPPPDMEVVYIQILEKCFTAFSNLF